MSEDNLSFEQILSGISDKEMMTPYLSRKSSQIEENNNLKISPEQQRFYLAFYARAAYEHVDFAKFSPENQTKFKSEIEQLYADIKSPRLQGDFLHEMADKTSKYIEDRHFEIGIGKEVFHGGDPKSIPSVGKNFMFAKKRNDFSEYNYTSVDEGYTEIEGQKIPTWSIGTMKKAEEDILIVSIPNLCRPNSYEGWKDFIETFDKIYTENKEKWDNGRIIIDVRGNKGGEDKPIDHVAKRLYGNMLNTYKRCEIKDTELSNYFLHKHGAYKPQNYERSGLKAKDLVHRRNFSGEQRTIFDETNVYYPFNEQKGYKGKIDILLDRDVGSSAESAYTSFYHHPNVRYIGENTAGMQQYTQGTFSTPWGGEMRVAVTKLTYWDKEGENIEVIGHKPDINCSGQDALNIALTIDANQDRCLGYREKNEQQSKNEIYAEYNPQDVTDTRKAYYAKFLDPAISKIEMQNKINKLRSKVISSENTQTIQKFHSHEVEDSPKPVRKTTIDISAIKQTQNEG